MPTRLKLREQLFQKKYDEQGLIYAHYRFMKKFGWISIEELKKIPIPTFLNLCDCIGEEDNAKMKRDKELNKKMRRKR